MSYEGTYALIQFSPNRIGEIKNSNTEGKIANLVANTTLGA